MADNKAFNKSKKPLLLCILDGFGIGDDNSEFNAISQARMTNYQRIINTYPHSQLQTSGLAVGLPEGQIGNSEVGHMTIGAGRVIYQDLPRINNAIADGSFAKNPQLQNLIDYHQNNDSTCHLAGLVSDGGVHSHLDHLLFLANYLEQNGVKIVIHAFLDGRDVAQKSAEKYLQKLTNFKIATLIGRYYAMDRDKKWDRIELAINAIIKGQGEHFSDCFKAIANSYQQNITDEFVKPCIIDNYQGVESEDSLIFFNFRADRARQISEKLMASQKFTKALALTHYSDQLDNFYKIIFPPQEVKNSLPEILAKNNLSQLRIAETEKYAHVTFFFSCGQEQEFSNEQRILVQSPKVATYDLKPEMSALEITKNLCQAINSDKYDFILVNYANPDMVGHSGDLSASIKACQIIDQQLVMLEQNILQKNGTMLISADHGNIECMRDNFDQPHTAHTLNPVPFILISNNHKSIDLKNGNLSDIAPSILKLLNITQPIEMTGKNLINHK